MRKLMCLFMAIAAMGCSSSQILIRDHGADAFRPLKELAQEPEGAFKRDCVAYLEADQAIPLRLSIDSDWLKLGQEQVTLVAKKRIYFWLALPEDATPERLQSLLKLDAEQVARMSEKERAAALAGVSIYLSPDGVRWATPRDDAGLKELFELRGGSVSVGMGMNQKEGVWVSLALQILGGRKAE